MISRMRDGLEKTHPAYEALRKAVEPVLAAHIARRRDEDANLAAETPQTRRRLSQLARIVARFSLDKEEELELELSSGRGGDPHAPALRFVPHFKRLEFGESATLVLIARRDAVRAVPAMAAIEMACEPRRAIDAPQQVMLEVLPGRALLRGTLALTAHDVPATATVIANVEGIAPCSASIEVAAPAPEVSDAPSRNGEPETFCFEHERYNVDIGKRRLLRLLAPKELVERYGSTVEVRSAQPEALEVRDARVALRHAAGGWYQARVCVEGKAAAGAAAVVARLGDSLEEAQTTLTVGREPSGPAMTIEIGQFGGSARARWQRDPDGNVTVTVNAAHPAAQRYLGDAPEFAGQESPLARMLIAEIVAEEVVRDLLARRFRGARIDADAYAAHRQRLLADLLPRCHAAQISPAEAESFLRQNGKTHAPRHAATVNRPKRQAKLFD
jgi:hypothetical protein